MDRDWARLRGAQLQCRERKTNNNQRAQRSYTQMMSIERLKLHQLRHSIQDEIEEGIGHIFIPMYARAKKRAIPEKG